jgi:hypothetical protein
MCKTASKAIFADDFDSSTPEWRARDESACVPIRRERRFTES